jgi:hypothetical protein
MYCKYPVTLASYISETKDEEEYDFLPITEQKNLLGKDWGNVDDVTVLHTHCQEHYVPRTYNSEKRENVIHGYDT